MDLATYASRMRIVVLATALASSFGATAGPHDPLPMNAADFTAHDIAAALYKAKLGEPVDYSHHNGSTSKEPSLPIPISSASTLRPLTCGAPTYRTRDSTAPS